MGMGLHLHFCGSKVADVALYAEGDTDRCCPTDTDSPTEDCCHNEAIIFQSQIENLPNIKEVAFTSQTVKAVIKPKVRFNLEDLLLGHVEQEKSLKPFPPPKQLSGKSFRIVCKSLVFYA